MLGFSFCLFQNNIFVFFYNFKLCLRKNERVGKITYLSKNYFDLGILLTIDMTLQFGL